MQPGEMQPGEMPHTPIKGLVDLVNLFKIYLFISNPY